MDLLPGHVERVPGKHSLKLGIPGLKYAAPLGLKKMELERTDRGSPVMRGSAILLETRWLQICSKIEISIFGIDSKANMG
jgi:hypothetical protein